MSLSTECVAAFLALRYPSNNYYWNVRIWIGAQRCGVRISKDCWNHAFHGAGECRQKMECPNNRDHLKKNNKRLRKSNTKESNLTTNTRVVTPIL